MSDFLYGINPVVEGLRGTFRRPLEVFLLRGATSPRLAELLDLAAREGVPVRQRERADLDRLAGHRHHQGVLLRVTPFAYADLDTLLENGRAAGQPPLLLVLDGVTDPHNFGAILRSAEAAGCNGVVVPKDRSCPVTPIVEKAAAGALAYLPLAQVVNVSRALEELKRTGIWVYGLAGEEGSAPLYRTDLAGPVALVAGSEGEGLRPNVRRHCDALLAIPLPGRVSSLNVSVAAAVALFEAVRQRAEKKTAGRE